nr:cytochrome C6, chloroplastic [Ipomoea batatas]
MRVSCLPRCCVSTACSVHPTEKRNVGEGGENPNLQTPKRSRQLNLLKSVAPPLMAVLVAFNPLFTPPGCNTLLEGPSEVITVRNGVDTEEEIYRVTYYGKGRMPGFGEECTPRGQCTFGPRLQEDEIKLLAEFVKSQADQGWPNGESGGN